MKPTKKLLFLLFVSLLAISSVAFAQTEEASNKEWFDHNKAELLCELKETSISAIYTTENGYWLADEISNSLVNLNYDGELKEKINLKHNTGPFSHDVFHRYDDNTLVYGTLLPNTAQLNKVIYKIDERKEKTKVQRNRVTRNPKVGPVAMDNFKSLKFGDYDIIYNELGSNKNGILANLYAVNPSNVSKHIYSLDRSSLGNKTEDVQIISNTDWEKAQKDEKPLEFLQTAETKKSIISTDNLRGISTTSNYTWLSIQKLNNHLYILDNLNQKLLVFNEQLELTNTLSVSKELASFKLHNENGLNLAHLYKDDKTNKLYVYARGKESDKRLTKIFSVDTKKNKLNEVASSQKRLSAFQIYDGYVYFLLPGEKITNPEHLQLKSHLAFTKRYKAAYRLKLI